MQPRSVEAAKLVLSDGLTISEAARKQGMLKQQVWGIVNRVRCEAELA